MDYIGARYPRPLPSFLKSDQEDYKILIVQNSIVLPNSPFPKGGYRGITGIPKCRGGWPYALSPPRLGKPEELEKRCPSQKDRWFGGIPQSINVIASGATQSHRIPLYLQARGDCFVVLLYGRTPRNDIHITPRLGELEGVERRLINKQPTKLVDTLGGLFWTGSSTLPPSPLEILKGLSFRFSEDEPFSLWQSKQFNAIIHRANLTANSHQFWE